LKAKEYFAGMSVKVIFSGFFQKKNKSTFKRIKKNKGGELFAPLAQKKRDPSASAFRMTRKSAFRMTFPSF